MPISTIDPPPPVLRALQPVWLLARSAQGQTVWFPSLACEAVQPRDFLVPGLMEV